MNEGILQRVSGFRAKDIIVVKPNYDTHLIPDGHAWQVTDPVAPHGADIDDTRVLVPSILALLALVFLPLPSPSRLGQTGEEERTPPDGGVDLLQELVDVVHPTR